MVDLGAAPGGWSQVAAERVRRARAGDGWSRSIFSRWMPVAGVEFRQMDFHDPEAPERSAMLGGGADGVLSDMAANATGHRKTDQLRIMALVELAADFAREVCVPAAAFSPRCCRAAPRASCSPTSSATSPPCAT